jgi:4-amino-4-deoxy-L-arabinose transferase-like glycosyltransferase
MQFVNGVVGALTPIVIFEIGLLLYDRRVATVAMLLTAFFPQIMFWSAAIYKDSAVMLCIALSIWAILRLKRRFQLVPLAIYLAAAGSLIWLRFYIFYVVIAATAAGFLVGQRRGLAFRLISQVAVVTCLFLVLLLTPSGKEMLAQNRFLDLSTLQASRSDLAVRGGSGFAADADVSTPEGLIQVLPVGVTYLLFAPFPWMVNSVRQLLALPDVLVWYALMPALLRGLFFALRHRLRETMPILVFTMSLTLAYGAFLGNAGTAYRQRTQIMMFYFVFIADGLRRGRKHGEAFVPNTEAEARSTM